MQSKLVNTVLIINTIFVLYSLLPCTYSAVSINSENVKQGVREFLHKCTSSENSTMDVTVYKAAILCIENGLAQVSGRRFRTKEDVPNTCRAVSSVIHCLQPLKPDIRKCSGEGEAALLDLIEDLCKDAGVKITEFQTGFECLQQNRKVHKSCLERIDGGEKYTQNLQKTLRNPCDAISILVECTREAFLVCSTKVPQEQLEKFLAELRNSNSDAYRCTTRIRNSADTVTLESMDTNSSSFLYSYCLNTYISVFGVIFLIKRLAQIQI